MCSVFSVLLLVVLSSDTWTVDFILWPLTENHLKQRLCVSSAMLVTLWDLSAIFFKGPSRQRVRILNPFLSFTEIVNFAQINIYVPLEVIVFKTSLELQITLHSCMHRKPFKDGRRLFDTEDSVWVSTYTVCLFVCLFVYSPISLILTCFISFCT